MIIYTKLIDRDLDLHRVNEVNRIKGWVDPTSPSSKRFAKYLWFCSHGIGGRNTRKLTIADNCTAISDITEVSYAEFWEKVIAFKNYTVKLNSEYTAEVSKDGIKVGCQTFSLDKFDELAKVVNQVRGL